MRTLQPNATLQGGKYIIKKVLGQGGFGITYLAENTMLEGKVAIKEFFFKEYCSRDEATSYVTIGTSGNRELVERFKQKFIKEARTIFKLNHPNIVRILDIFEENGTAYYVMDYIEGESLGDMLKRRGAIPEAEAVGYIKEVSSALSYIHGKSINHLDIKPNNIMKRQEDGKILLIDFGVSKQYDAETAEGTTTTPVGISYGYSPAEQYEKNGVSSFSPQSDIYSLGATLYKLITGDTPPEAIKVAQMDGILPVDASISGNIKNAITKAIQFRKEDRPQTVSEFLSIIDSSNCADSCAINQTIEDDETTQIVGQNEPSPAKSNPKIYSLESNPAKDKYVDQFLKILVDKGYKYRFYAKENHYWITVGNRYRVYCWVSFVLLMIVSTWNLDVLFIIFSFLGFGDAGPLAAILLGVPAIIMSPFPIMKYILKGRFPKLLKNFEKDHKCNISKFFEYDGSIID